MVSLGRVRGSDKVGAKAWVWGWVDGGVGPCVEARGRLRALRPSVFSFPFLYGDLFNNFLVHDSDTGRQEVQESTEGTQPWTGPCASLPNSASWPECSKWGWGRDHGLERNGWVLWQG